VGVLLGLKVGSAVVGLNVGEGVVSVKSIFNVCAQDVYQNIIELDHYEDDG